MHRIALWLTLLSLLAAGCGGGGSDSTPPSAEIPGQLAQELAAQADAIAAAFESGDTCGAAQQADQLFEDVSAAVEGGDVPPSLQDTLVETARKLQNEINCPPPEKKEEDHKGKGKAKGHIETTTTVDTTVTEEE